MADHDQSPKASAKVVIHEVIIREGYELMTSAEVDDYPYVGTQAWRIANPEVWRALQVRMKRPRR
jgi:hypothetical protein